MKLNCSKCGEFLIECNSLRAINVSCPHCNQRHSNLMYNDIDKPLDLSKPPEMETYVETK